MYLERVIDAWLLGCLNMLRLPKSAPYSCEQGVGFPRISVVIGSLFRNFEADCFGIRIIGIVQRT
jgi:hypothetical protein